MQFPLALVGIAMAVVVFPVFSAMAKAGRKADLGRTLSQALRTTFFLALPSAAGLLVLAGPLIALIYERGKFHFDPDTISTAPVLQMYALGVPAYCGLQVMTRLFYSLEEVKTPVRVGAIMVGVNLVLNVVLVFPLRESGLALATSISAALNLAVLTILARRKLGIAGLGGVFRSFLSSLLFAAAMGAAVFWTSRLLAHRYPARELVSKLLWVFPPLLLGIVLYLGAAWLLRRPEIRSVRLPSQNRTGSRDSDTGE